MFISSLREELFNVATAVLVVVFLMANIILLSIKMGFVMTITEWLLLLWMVLAAVFFTGMLIHFFIKFNELALKNRFKKNLKLAIIHSQPTWDSIKIMLATYKLGTDNYLDPLESIQECYQESITENDKELSKYSDLLNGYIAQYKAEFHLYGLPDDILMHLDQLPIEQQTSHPIKSLVAQVKKVLAIKTKKAQRHRYYTIASFVIALLSFGVAIYTLL